jgi:diacylglycerol kinase (ATP)
LSSHGRVFVIFNPRSGRGRGAQFVAPVLDALSQSQGLEHALTTGPGDEERLAALAIDRGFSTLVAVGGDGTWSNVGNGILRSGKPVALGLVPGGTGCDLAKSLGIPAKDVRAAGRIILAGHTRKIDAGRIEERYFLNIAGFGYDIAVLEDSWTVGYLEGELLYLYCAIRQLGSFPGFPVEIAPDGGAPEKHELLMLILANARVFGGGFKIAPDADLGDGRLDVLAFRNMGFWPRVGIMVKLLAGTHRGSPQVAASRASSLTLRFPSPPAYETDGEWHRAKSAEVRVETIPAALQVLVPADAPFGA